MTVAMRQANADDLADLLELMQEFYAEAGYALNPDRARAAFLPLLAPGHTAAGVPSLTTFSFGPRCGIAEWGERWWSRHERSVRSSASAPCTWRWHARMGPRMRP